MFSIVRPKEWKFETIWSPLSDHKILVAQISLEGFIACKNQYTQKNREIALGNCENAAEFSMNFQEFLQTKKELEKRNNPYKVVRNKIVLD
jgi:hypothetical protein